MKITLRTGTGELVERAPDSDNDLLGRITSAAYLLINDLDTIDKKYIVTVEVEEVK